MIDVPLSEQTEERNASTETPLRAELARDALMRESSHTRRGKHTHTHTHTHSGHRSTIKHVFWPSCFNHVWRSVVIIRVIKVLFMYTENKSNQNKIPNLETEFLSWRPKSSRRNCSKWTNQLQVWWSHKLLPDTCSLMFPPNSWNELLFLQDKEKQGKC